MIVQSGPTATPTGDGIYGPARGLRLTSDEQEMLTDLVGYYGETSSEVLRIALKHLFERVCEASTPVPEPAVS